MPMKNSYGLKDRDRSSTYTLGNLDNITSSTYSTSSSNAGWYIALNGEKLLADPYIFNGRRVFYDLYRSDERQRLR